MFAAQIVPIEPDPGPAPIIPPDPPILQQEPIKELAMSRAQTVERRRGIRKDVSKAGEKAPAAIEDVIFTTEGE